MPKKPSYEILESEDVSITQSVKMPRKIKAVVKGFKNGGYLWLPKEWAGRTVVIALEDSVPSQVE